MAYIYEIKNTINNKVYIGSARNYKHRWYSHKWKLKNNKHENLHLQSAWNKYGGENFEFSVLEECDDDLQYQNEQKYLNEVKPFSPNGYNIVKTAKGGNGGNSMIGEYHPLSTLTNDEVLKIKKMLSEGYKQKYIIEKMGYTWGTIGKIASLDRWADVGVEYNEQILNHQRNKWDDSMMEHIIKFKNKGKQWDEIGEILNFSKNSLLKRYNDFIGKDFKLCKICNAMLDNPKPRQKYCDKCRRVNELEKKRRWWSKKIKKQID